MDKSFRSTQKSVLLHTLRRYFEPNQPVFYPVYILFSKPGLCDATRWKCRPEQLLILRMGLTSPLVSGRQSGRTASSLTASGSCCKKMIFRYVCDCLVDITLFLHISIKFHHLRVVRKRKRLDRRWRSLPFPLFEYPSCLLCRQKKGFQGQSESDQLGSKCFSLSSLAELVFPILRVQRVRCVRRVPDVPQVRYLCYYFRSLLVAQGFVDVLL